jgi:hypothetical protein
MTVVFEPPSNAPAAEKATASAPFLVKVVKREIV